MPSLRFVPSLIALFALASPSFATRTVSTLQPTLNQVSDVAIDAGGNVFVTQRAPNNAVIKFTNGQAPATTFATGFADPSGIVIDSQGNLFVSCYTGARVDKVTPGGTRTVFATGVTSPGAIVVDASDNLYVGEYYSQAVKKITPAGVVSAYGAAGLGSQSGTTRRLTAMCYEPDGSILCGTFGPGDGTGPFPIRRIPAGGGTGAGVVVSSLPITGIMRGPLGYHYFTCYQNDVIARSVLPAAPVVYAGANNVAGNLNGALSSARFNYPAGLAIDHLGIIYITDTFNDAVRTIFDNEGDGPTAVEPATWGQVKRKYR